MPDFLKKYFLLPHAMINLFWAELMIQLVNATFFILLNFYFKKEGYNDPEIANFISYRYLALILCALPLGIYIKDKKLRPFLLFTAVIVPFNGLLAIYSIGGHYTTLIYITSITWGIALASLKVMTLPFILRNLATQHHSEAIALHHSTFGLSLFTAGVCAAFLPEIYPFLNEKLILQSVSIISVSAIFFVFKIKIKEVIPTVNEENKKFFKHYDWGAIIRVMIPTFIVATGAGLTIPFVNLFFYHIFNTSFDEFSLLTSLTAILVFSGTLLMPLIKRKFGYHTAITGSQSLAVIALVLLASMDHFSYWEWAFYIAVFCFVIRQPLMNMGSAMISELTMYYVKDKNRELVSAMSAAVWSGSWFISSQLFRYFRSIDISYGNIFYITAGMYALGVVLYYHIINSYNKRTVSLA